jgi:hypothetical protein
MAAWGAAAVMAAWKGDPDPTNAADTIADILHALDAFERGEGRDPAAAIEQALDDARMHYVYESRREGAAA